MNFIMSDSTFRPVGALVKSVSTSAVADPGIDADKANRSWQLTVNADIIAHTRVTLEDNVLVVFADSSVWGHAVSQQKNTIMAELKSRGISCEEIIVNVKPRETERVPTITSRDPEPIESASAKVLEESAHTVTTPGLRKVLQRLSQHRQPDN